MSWFRPSHASQCQIERLDQAERGLIASQADLRAEVEATVGTVVAVREHEEASRAELRETSRRAQERPLHTSGVRETVEIMLADMDRSADHRAQRRH